MTYFHHKDPRHDRPLGEMPGEELVVDGDVLDCYGGHTLLVFNHAVHKQEWESGEKVPSTDGE